MEAACVENSVLTGTNTDKKVVRMFDARNDVPGVNATEPIDTASEVCSRCFGTGTWLNPEKGPILCTCRRTSSEGRIDLARIPRRFRESSLHNYYPKNESQFFALGFANTLVENYPAVEAGLLFMGGVGVGKTHLAVAILQELIKKGRNCLFYESGSLLKAIQESYSSVSQTSEMRVLSPVLEAEVLVLDELGATVSTDWVRDTLYQIINTRYNNKKLSIFTTNYLDELYVEGEARNLKARKEELKNAPFSRENSHEEKELDKRLLSLTSSQLLEDRIGVRLRSRLYEMCRKVELTGADYRKKFASRESSFPPIGSSA
ncbi:MAG: ATP-binding protein [Pyrinomonadaceae bacterium]